MKTILVLILSFSAFIGNAQFDDGCDEVLRLASRDVTIQSNRANTAKYIYDSYCKGSQVDNSINIDLVDEDLFENFSFGFGSKKEKLEQICKTYESNYKQIVENDIESRIVVREAISSWEKCKALSNSGIKIRPQILSTQFTVDLARQGDDIVVNGVDYDTDKCECVAVLKDQEGNETTQTVDSGTKHIINNGKTWNIRCTRKYTEIDDVKYFPETDFVLPTSKGTFAMTLPKNINPKHNWIKSVINEIESLKQNLNTNTENLDGKIQKIDSRISNVEFKKICVSVQGDCGGSKFANIKAPEGFVYAFDEFNSWKGGPCGQGSKCKIFIKIPK